VDGGQNSVEDYPDFAHHLLGLQQLKAATTLYYADAEFRDHDGLGSVTKTPGTVVAVFANPKNRKTGIVLSNLTDQKQTVGFELQAPKTIRARVFPQGEMGEIDLSKPVSVQLAPHQILILAIDASLSQPN
jgi:hypothetical protein